MGAGLQEPAVTVGEDQTASGVGRNGYCVYSTVFSFLPAAFYPEAPIGDKGVLSLPHITYPPYIAGWVSSIR